MTAKSKAHAFVSQETFDLKGLFDCGSVTFFCPKSARTKAKAESAITGDSVTRPLTKDPIQGKINIKMKGNDSAVIIERTINATDA